MRNVNQRRKYAKIKWKPSTGSQIIGTALHETNKKMLEEEGVSIECGGEIDLISLDRDELRKQIIEKNRRTLDKFYNATKKREGFVEMMERLNKISLNRPEDSSENG